MKITTRDLAPQDASTPLLAVGVFEGEKPVENGIGRLDAALGNRITLAQKHGDFNGKIGQVLSLYGGGRKGPRTVLVVGLGKRKEWTPEKIRRSFGEAGKCARTLKITEATLQPPLKGFSTKDEERSTVAAVEGFVLATYRYVRRGRDKDKYPNLKTLLVIPGETTGMKGMKAGVSASAITVDSTLFARDLAATPGMDLYPEAYGRIAKKLASKTVKVRVLKEAELKKLGMGALLAVGQGSTHRPVFIHLSYNPGNLPKTAKTLALVGKGVTFDSGGLDLKPADGMRDMKIDMAGSAAVMGIFKALEKWKPRCKVEGFIAAAENMADGNAYRPGDVLTSLKGLTIEVDNTDAEGRLTLADALTYAAKTVKPNAMIDMATLTGACWIALGNHATGMMGTDDKLAEVLSRAGEETGERVWRLPLWEEYTEQISSEIADIKNTGGRPGGAITAGAFLKEFVNDVPWIHLDIAGTASEVPVSYVPHKELPTGVGVRLVLETLRHWA
ncbi:MAG: leucyl aminopeptidase [bacterium]